MAAIASASRALRRLPRLVDVIARPVEGPIVVQGWAKAVRTHKRHSFVELDDGSGPERLQLVAPSELVPPELSWGAAVEARGSLKLGPRDRPEVFVERLRVVGACPADEFPFVCGQPPTAERARRYPHLRHRTDAGASALRVRGVAAAAVREAFAELGYLETHAPALTSNDCEGAGEVFSVSAAKAPAVAYFDSPCYLTVSAQLHLEALAHGLDRVYSFGPTFRAENSKSRLHLSEFYMIEAETAFVDELDSVRELVEELVKRTIAAVEYECAEDLRRLRGDYDFGRLREPFPILKYDDAIEALSKSGREFETRPVRGEALGKEHELALVELMNGVPTFVVEWPEHLKPFYMKRLRHDSSKVAALDLLVPITGEVAGGSLRENDYEVIKNRLPSNEMNWYLDLRKFGGVPTGGFGLGFERLLQFICNITNIKDTIPFPRWPHNCSM